MLWSLRSTCIRAKAGTRQNDRSNDEDYWYHRRCGSRQKHSFELPGKAFVCLCHTGGPGRSSGYGTRRTLLCSGDRFIWKKYCKNDNTIDRKAVSDVVFCNEQMRCRLNEIIHPAVKAFILERIEEEQKNGRGLFVVEAALLLEDHYDTICHKIWYIHTDQEIRIQRLMESRGYSRQKAESIIASQASEAYFRSHADYVVTNNGLLDETYRQIDEGIKKL